MTQCEDEELSRLIFEARQKRREFRALHKQWLTCDESDPCYREGAPYGEIDRLDIEADRATHRAQKRMDDLIWERDE